ncbi:MAG: TonB-dependent receptor, partial [Pseudomonadales bacterium]
CQYLADCIDTDSNGIVEAQDPREVTFDRLNFRIGDSYSEQIALSLNAGVEAGQGEAYGFLTYSMRENTSAGFYRRANQTANNPTLADGNAFVPDGFLPLINTEIDDLSFGVGYKMILDGDIGMDVSYTYGRNDFNFNISNSVNASFVNFQRFDAGLSDADIRATTARSADAGELSLGLHTINLNFTQPLNKINLAYGLELRRDEYEIEPGEEYSYRDFDTDDAGNSLYAADADAGIQVFPGFSPANKVDEERNVLSAYIDGEYDVNEAWLLSAALRFDDYDDFGSSTNFKLASSYELADWVKLRGAISTGFRAPSMQQQFFNNISTQFVTVGTSTVAQQRGTFRNDSAVARAIGIPELNEEKSNNYSGGLVLTPLEGWNITVDLYKIDIEDSIVLSGGLTSSLGDPNLTAALVAAGASSAQFFLNGADTETKGIDIVTSYTFLLGDGELGVALAANKTETEVERIFTSGGLATLTPQQVFTPQDISIIEEWQPEDRINLTFDYSLGGFSTVLSFNRYGEYTVCEGACTGQNRQTFGAKVLTDLRFAYAMENGLSFNVGGNNIFDETPDKNKIGQSRAGVIEASPGGNIIVDSEGVFQFSRRSAPFGFNGAYVYAGVGYDF